MIGTIPYLNTLNRTIPYLNTLPSATGQFHELRQASRQPIRIEHERTLQTGQPIRIEYYVTGELSARVEVPSPLSARVGSP